MRAVPFRRFHMLMVTIAAAMGAGITRDMALQQAGGYDSRGHGKNRLQASRNTVARAKRAAVKAANRARNRRAHK